MKRKFGTEINPSAIGNPIQREFQEWIEPDLESDVLSLEYIEDFDNGVDIIEI